MDKYSKTSDSLPMYNHYAENGEILLNGKKLNGLQFLRELKILKSFKEKLNLEILPKAIWEIATF